LNKTLLKRLILATALGVMSTPLMAQTVLMQKQGTQYSIDGGNGSVQNELPVYLWESDANNVNQQWVEIDRGDNFYSYQRSNSSLCIDGGDGGALGQAIVLSSCDESNLSQHWNKVSVGGSSYRLEKRDAPEYSMDGNRGAAARQELHLWASSDTNENQQWEFFVAEDGTAPIESNSDLVSIPGTIEAEDFTGQSGIQTESTSDTNGGENVGYINDGDHTEYQIDVQSDGVYDFTARVASRTNGGTIGIEANNSLVGSIDVGGTGGWQVWETVSTTVQLNAGSQTLRLAFSGGEGYLINVNSLSLNLSDGTNPPVPNPPVVVPPVEPPVPPVVVPPVDTNPSLSGLVHPGGWHTQEDLTLIRNKVAAGEEPWITGWNAIKDSSPDENFTSNESELVTSNGAMHTAGFAAWVLTMKWVASGDQAYADAAIGVIDHWVDNVKYFDVYGPTLTLSTGAGAMAQAAEVLEHGFNGEAGWPAQRADAAKAWFREAVYDTWTNTGDQRSSNWGTSALGGNMSMAVFMDDMDEFEYQSDAYKYGYQDTDDGCAAVTDYISFESGQAQETGRDQAHVQGGIAHLTEAALVAFHQGVDLVGVADNRVRAGVEYHAKYNLGYNDLTFDPDIYNPCDIWMPGQDQGISPDERGNFSPVYYMSSRLFTKAGLDHPYTKEVIASPGYAPEINNFAHPGLGTLVFQNP